MGRALLRVHLAGVVVVPLDVRSAPEFVGTVLDRTEPRLVITSRFTLRQGLVLDYPTLDLQQRHFLVARGCHATATGGGRFRRPGFHHVHLWHDGRSEGGDAHSPQHPVQRDRGRDATFGRSLVSADLATPAQPHAGTDLRTPYAAPRWRAHRISVSRQPSAIFRTIREQQITMICLVPQALDLFFSAIEREARRAGRERQLAKGLRIAEHLPIEARRIVFRPFDARMGAAPPRHLRRCVPRSRSGPPLGADGRKCIAGLWGDRGLAHHHR